jgi:hypothetical protein
MQSGLPDDAVSMRCYADSGGMRFDGRNKYVLRFGKEFFPEENTFWSITLYNDKSLFYGNSLNRHSVSVTKTLKKDGGGSTEIYIQHETPGKSKESNWLPAPKGAFFIVFNAYRPKQEIILPYVRKTD